MDLHLQEEWTLVLGLRAGRPEPVGQWSGFGCGDEVAQSHRLLQDVERFLVGLHSIGARALQDGNEVSERMTMV